MRQPFYFRPPEYRYTLRSEMGYGWWTGVIQGELQLLRSVRAAVTFNRTGELLRLEDVTDYPVPAEWRNDPKGSEIVRPTWAITLDFQECPIRVKRFWVPERWLGIEDMPHILSEYYTDREKFLTRRDVRPEDAEWWKTSEQLVFHSGCGDYWINNRGEVETS